MSFHHERALLAIKAFDIVTTATETLAEDNVGTALAYLLGALEG